MSKIIIIVSLCVGFCIIYQDPAHAIAGLANFQGTIIVLEQNGNNPALKLIEKFSSYHVEHEEQSFPPHVVCSWLKSAGFSILSNKVFNLVPMFCNDDIAKFLQNVSPYAERLPLIRNIMCG